MSLSKYLFESLSEKNVKTLKDYINDENFDEMMKVIINHYKRLSTTGIKYAEFFKKKGLSNRDFDSNVELGKQIADIFIRHDDIERFNEIIHNNGILPFNDLISDSIINIKDKLDLKPGVYNEIANIKNVTSNNVNVGKFEILLKFILKENSSFATKGDVVIKYNNQPLSIEVKEGNSAHPGSNVLSSQEVSNYFTSLYNKKSDVILFGSNKMNIRLNDFFNNEFQDKKIDVNLFIKNLCKAVYYQYNNQKPKEDNEVVNSVYKVLKEYNEDSEYTFVTEESIKVDTNKVYALLQVLYYKNKEQFDYLLLTNIDSGNVFCNKIDINVQTLKALTNTLKITCPEGNVNAIGRRATAKISIA